MKNNLQEKPRRVGIRPNLSKSPNKLIVGISALISMLAIAAYKEENNPSAKQVISNYSERIIDKPKSPETKNEAEVDIVSDTAAKLQPLIKLLIKNTGTSYTVVQVLNHLPTVKCRCYGLS